MKPIEFRGKETMSYNKAEHSLPPAEGAEEPCKCCDGTGVCEDIGGEKGACMTCNGSGKWKWQQPTAEGAETIQPHITCPKCSSTNNSELAKNNRLCYDCNHSWSEQQPKLDPKKVQWSGYGELGNISQKPLQPTAEGAEEINKMIGQTKDRISKRYNKNYWEILGDYHSNGRLTTNDFIDELLTEFAAQQQPTAEGEIPPDPTAQAGCGIYDPTGRKPTAEGAEEILEKYLIRDPISKKSALEAMQEFAALQNKPQPTAEGAEEYFLKKYPLYKDIKPNEVTFFREKFFEMLTEFATLHAQKIADKMVSERCAKCKHRGLPDSINEALNSGDGVYRP